MTLITPVLERLAALDEWGYRAGTPGASEPTALAALALASYGEHAAAERARDWLSATQAADGSVGICRDEPTPGWPTALAVLAWLSGDDGTANTPDENEHDAAIDRAVGWLLETESLSMPQSWQFGHDKGLVGWPWVIGTHGWVIPTAFSVLALKAAGYGDHPRTREAVALLLDRLLAGGGANYGNTIVLGRQLLPQLEPTGVALLALANESPTDARLEHSLDYAVRSLPGCPATVSLCWGLLGVTAHGRRPKDADQWVVAPLAHTLDHDPSPWKLALLALAACDDGGLLVQQPSQAILTDKAAHDAT